MNYIIYPKNMERTLRSGWIVRFLKCIGVIQVLLFTLTGLFIGGPYAKILLVSGGYMVSTSAEASGMLIGLAVGIVVGLVSSLTVFALAQVVDDLQAIRIQTGAYIAIQSDKARLE